MLDKKLAAAIAIVESSGQPLALRYEPASRVLPHDIVKQQNHCDSYTAKILNNTSFGLYQIMGYNLINLGLKYPFVDYLYDDDMQNEFFELFLVRNNINVTYASLINNDTKIREFARIYNGPNNIDDYAKRLSQVLLTGVENAATT